MKHELGFMRPRWGTGAEPWVPVPLQLTGAAGTWIGIPANVAAELGIAEGSAQEVSVGGSVAYGRATILHAPARYVELSMGAVQALLAAGVGVATWD